MDVIEGYTNFPRESFAEHVPTFYPLAMDLLNRDLNSEIRLALQALLRRVGEVKLGLALPPTPSPQDTASSIHSDRRHSRGR